MVQSMMKSGQSKVDETELPIIDSVRTLNTKEIVETIDDPFAVEADIAKNYGGIEGGKKRKMTTQIRKAYTGQGVSSSRIDEKLLVGYDIFGVVPPPLNLYTFAKLYEMSPGHYAAVNAKTANIVGLGFNLVETRKTKRAYEKVSDKQKKLDNMRAKLEAHKDELLDLMEQFNDEDTFIEILTKVWRDYETTGNGYIEAARKRDGSIGYVGHIPSPTMRIRKDRDGYVQVVHGRVQFFRNFGDRDTPSPFNYDNIESISEVIHIKKYSPTNTFYGIPDIIAAQQAIAGNEYSSQYNLDFFKNKAVPKYVITIKGARLGPQAESQLLQFFQSDLKGQNHRSIFIPLPPDTADNKVEFNMEAVETGVQEASFANYRKMNLDEILMAHRVPITKISVAAAASVAIAQDADKTFKEQVCAPEQRILEKKLNLIIKEFTDAFEIKLNEMTLTDEKTRAAINDIYLKDGVLLRNEVRADLGRSGIDKGDSMIDINAKGGNQQMNDQRANRERDNQRAQNATDSAGNARTPKGQGRTQGTE